MGNVPAKITGKYERSIEVDELEEEIVKSKVSNENDIDEFDSNLF